jgi:hypothetical protein
MALLFLIPALDRGSCSATRSCRISPGDRALGVHCIGGRVASEPVWTLWRREESLARLIGRRIALPTELYVLLTLKGSAQT